MDFIETLKSVGGVKPCPSIKQETDNCHLGCQCHGTGQTLDLAPLLAKPDKLHLPVRQLIHEIVTNEEFDEIVIIGPQRASNLVYEVARQLGGTAVVAEPEYGLRGNPKGNMAFPPIIAMTGYRLSLPIPPDATCLFVTDKVDEKEMSDVVLAVVPDPCSFRFAGGTVLPYVLALVGGSDKLVIAAHVSSPQGFIPSSLLSIISLHKENQ
jgi:hypothetical protein